MNSCVRDAILASHQDPGTRFTNISAINLNRLVRLLVKLGCWRTTHWRIDMNDERTWRWINR